MNDEWRASEAVGQQYARPDDTAERTMFIRALARVAETIDKDGPTVENLRLYAEVKKAFTGGGWKL